MRNLNKDQMKSLQNLLRYSDKYEISIQFWPEQTAVFISKEDIELIDFGGDFEDVMKKSIEYLNRINNHGNN